VTSEKKEADLHPDDDIHVRMLRAYGRDFAQLYRQEKEARQALEERQNDLSMLIDVHSRLARCVDVASLLDVLAETFSDPLGVPRVLIYVRAAHGEGLDFATGRAEDPMAAPGLPPPVTPAEGLYSAFVIESHDSIVADGADANTASWFGRTYPPESVPEQVTYLALPGRTSVQGVVALDGGDQPVLTESSHRSVATLLAKQAGVLLENALMYEQSQNELTTVRELYDKEQQKLIAEHQFENLVGASQRMQQIFSTIRTVGDVNVPVLVLGETGTGKELAARALHYCSSRKAQPFVSVNCAALPGELVETELFGHEKGAFTGATQRRIGKVEMAQGGTLFLDEIADMPASLQVKLLRFLQERTFERVGGSALHQADVRVVAATNRDIAEAIRDGSLRPDLLYRLNTITLPLPPLRERMDDLPLLVDHFLNEANTQYGCTIAGATPEVYETLLAHRWPGNVRELKNVVDRASILAREGQIERRHIHLGMSEPAAAEPAAASIPIECDTDRPMMDAKQELTEQFERTYIDNLLRRCAGNVAQAARTAKIDRKNFVEKMHKYGFERSDYLVGP